MGLSGLAAGAVVLASLSSAVPGMESALPEANSFLSECQQFGNIAWDRNVVWLNRSRQA